ncbi:MAG: sensor histidine kinase [Actinomycetota bacterium]|nr:sensor histidine kinase [Actinomycetota bacterium]
MSALQPGWGGEGNRPGRFGFFFAAIWTVFLISPFSVGWQHRDTVGGWVGMAATLAFLAWYLLVFARRRIQVRQGRWDVHIRAALGWLLVGVTLSVLTCFGVGQAGTATAVYLAVVCAMTLPNPWAVGLALAIGAITFSAGLAVPRWHREGGVLLGILGATLAVWGIQQLAVRNAQLVAAQEENRRLVVSEERTRFARDLHDILGHSLTVITVKAELAQRLLDFDPDRARAELADLERLSRDALADIRRAVEGYRELTLPGELARARTALAAAEIDADLPNSTDEVPTHVRELFAWTVREGVTNVIRHSGARSCTVRLTPEAAEVVDDGRGPVPQPSVGSGLVGLRERASAVGGTVVTRGVEPSGYALRVRVP